MRNEELNYQQITPHSTNYEFTIPNKYNIQYFLYSRSLTNKQIFFWDLWKTAYD